VTTDVCVGDREQQSDPKFVVGQDIAKMFHGELYRVFIVDVDEDTDNGGALYCVQYDDGDGDDLNEDECGNAIDLYKKLENGDVDEWEMGDE